jgi:hypothetical protein
MKFKVSEARHTEIRGKKISKVQVEFNEHVAGTAGREQYSTGE